jgi:hypothetical protein
MASRAMPEIVRVLEVSCPKHGPKIGLMQGGVIVDIPFLASQRDIERAEPLCFECKEMGIRRKLTVFMEPAGESDQL